MNCGRAACPPVTSCDVDVVTVPTPAPSKHSATNLTSALPCVDRHVRVLRMVNVVAALSWFHVAASLRCS
jgi:hypothetical protein